MEGAWNHVSGPELVVWIGNWGFELLVLRVNGKPPSLQTRQSKPPIRGKLHVMWAQLPGFDVHRERGAGGGGQNTWHALLVLCLLFG